MSEPNPTVAVLGQGPMGAALTHALLKAKVPTTVWNRTRQRAEAQAAAGARIAPNAEAAVRAADLVIGVLRDGNATRAVLEPIPGDAFRGRTIVNFATSTPGEARRMAEWAAERRTSWLSGAIMVPTPLVGTPDALFLYSGERALFDAHADVLAVLGGDARHVGTDHGLASLLDTGMLEVFFAGMTGFLHATAMVTGQGLKATDFLPFAEVMINILPASLAGLARDVDAGTYPGTEDNLTMELAALGHIVDTSDDLGLDGRFPRVMRDLAAAAVDSGHGGDGWSRIIEQLRKPA
ncbi:NAD(P)-dependent oxidoreductase [Micromonospora sp. WMMD558]|uniref:NAD(P)-dependent oxidoreductase n=1 Tax=Micromonospora sp. WMMD558 TaxID=3403462 RepID=UPI003BF5935C